MKTKDLVASDDMAMVDMPIVAGLNPLVNRTCQVLPVLVETRMDKLLTVIILVPSADMAKPAKPVMLANRMVQFVPEFVEV